MSQLSPLIGGNTFDGNNLVEHQQFFPIPWKAQCALDFLPEPEPKPLHQRAGHAYIFWNREKVEQRPTQHTKRIGNLIEKTLRRNSDSQTQRRTNQVQNSLMPGSIGMNS